MKKLIVLITIGGFFSFASCQKCGKCAYQDNSGKVVNNSETPELCGDEYEEAQDAGESAGGLSWVCEDS